MNNNKKRCNASLYVRRPNMEANDTLENTRHLWEKSKLINYLDVNCIEFLYFADDGLLLANSIEEAKNNLKIVIQVSRVVNLDSKLIKKKVMS